MFARLLLFAAVVAPVFAQDDDVTKYIEELRAPKPPRDVQAEQRELLSTLRQRLDESTELAQKAQLYLRISGVEQSLGEFEAAIAAARNAHDLDPRDDRITFGLAGVLVRNRQTAEVPSLLGVDPSDGAALLRKALTAGDTSVAVFCAELAHSLLPYDAQAADTLGEIYLRQAAWSQAGAAYGQAVAQAPQVATYHYHLAIALRGGGRIDQAKAELLLALACDPAEKERENIQTALARLDTPPPTKRQ
jgi:tetratricopeptide (TPR) repeat protein